MNARPPRRWRRWAWRLLLAIVVARLLLAVFLTQLLGLAAGAAGLRLTMRTASLSLTGMSLRLQDLTARDAAQPDAPPLLTAQDLELDVSMRYLLAGDIVVVDAALADAVVTLRRDAAGRWNVPAAWTAPSAEATPPPRPTSPLPVSFSPPLRVVSARVHALTVRIDDAAATPPLVEQCTIDVDVREIGDGQTGELTVRAHGPRWFDAMWLRARATTLAERCELTWDGELRGVQPATLPFTLPPVLAAVCGNGRAFDASLRGQLTGQVSASTPTQPHYVASVRLSVDAGGEETLGLLVSAGPTSAAADTTTVPFAAELSARALLARALFTEGQLRFGAGRTSVQTRLACDQLTLAALRPTLVAAGVQVPPDGVRVNATLALELGDALAASVQDLDVRHGSEQLRLARAAVSGLRTGDGITVDLVEVVGPDARVRRAADGALHVAGVRLGSPPTTGPALAPAPAPSAAPVPVAAAPPLPRLSVGRLAWTAGDVVFVDELLQPPAELRVDELTVHARRFTCGMDGPPGTLGLSARVRGAAGRLRVEATTTPRANGFAADASVDAVELTGAAIAPWLAAAGITPVLRDGVLTLRTSASVAFGPTATTLELQLRDASLRDGTQQLMRVEHVQGTGLTLSTNAVATGAWLVEGPEIAVHRDADGGLRMLGLRFAPGGAAPAAAPPAPAAPGPAAATGVVLGSLALRDARVALSREGDPAPSVVVLDATLGDRNGGASTLPFSLEARLDGAAARVSAGGRLTRSLQRVDATVTATGLRADELQRLLPGVPIGLTNGSLSVAVELAADPAPRTGVSLALDRLRLVDDGEELVAIDRFVVALRERGDDRVHVAELAATGVRATITHTDDGTLVAGLLLPAANAPGAANVPPSPPAAVAADASLGSALRLPLLAVDALALAADVTVRDRRAGGGEPLALHAELSMEPWAARADGERGPPARLRLQASAAPLCSQLRVDIALEPYELEPTAELTLAASGIDLTALQRVWPGLVDRLEGTTATAELNGVIQARLDTRRRDPRVVDFARPFGGDVVVEQLALRDTTTGATLASVGSIDVDVRAIDPTSGSVLLRSVDIEDVALEAVRTSRGLELAGLRLVTAPAAAPDVAGTTSTSPRPAGAAPVAAPPPPTTSGPEFAIDHLRIAGLRLGLGDKTTQPPTVLPIEDGEIEVHRFTTRLATQPRPFAFSFSLRGGDVGLTKRSASSSTIGNLLGSAADVVSGGRRDEVEQRALFDEIAASGQLQFVPWLSGRIRATVTALELPALRGLAGQGGVTIDDGLFDQVVTIEFRGPEGIDVRSNQVAQHLNLSEGAGGAISSYLGLSMSLSTVLFLLRTETGEHQLPVAMHIPASGMTRAGVFDLVAESLARQIGAAVGGAASRTVYSARDLFFGSGVTPPVVVTLPFAPGDPLPGPELEQVRTELAADAEVGVTLEHELGAGDLVRARELALPPLAAVEAQARHLRERRTGLLTEREPLAAQVAALYAGGRIQEARVQQERLLRHDHTTGELERTLDRVLAMLDDSPRAQKRRVNAAAQALAASRLRAVRAELLRTLPDLDAERIVVRVARAVTNEELTAGGRVVATIRSRAIHELPPERARTEGTGTEAGRGTAPPHIADPAGRPLDPTSPHWRR